MSEFKFFKLKQKLSLTLGSSEGIGKLYESDDGLLHFDGNVDESAKVFFEHFCELNNTSIARASKENNQLQQDKAELFEALKALVKVEHERGGTLGVSGSFNYPVPEGVFIKAKKLLEKHK